MYSTQEVLEKSNIRESLSVYTSEMQEIEGLFTSELLKLEQIQKSLSGFIQSLRDLVNFKETYANLEAFTLNVLAQQEVRDCLYIVG
jgi:hypothetical protein